MLKFWKKKEEIISRETPGFEEDERRVPKTGLLLLLVMVIAGLFFGWRALDDIARLPQAPEALSFCSNRYFDNAFFYDRLIHVPTPSALYEENYYAKFGYQNSSGCVFSERERVAGIPALFLERDNIENEVRPLRDTLRAVEESLQEIRYQIERITREYSIGLQEKGARVAQPIFPISTTAPSLSALRQEEERLLAEQTQLKGKIRSFDARFKEIDDRLKEAYRPVLRAYNRELRWYEFKVFVLQMLLALPLFWIVFGLYLRLHRKNSPYTLIATAMVVVAAVLFLRVMLVWFWGLFLQSLLETLWEWIQRYRILQSLVFYGGMILSFVVFGGAVYYLQKKIFDPRRVAIRRFRQKQCPRCQASLDLAGEFCPNCGYMLKKKCTSCGNSRFSDLPICPHCGAKET